MQRKLLLLPAVWLSLVAVACWQPSHHTVETESEIFSMDAVYKSMLGPHDDASVTLATTPEPEVLWVTAIHAEIVGADGETPESPEYFCHSVLTRRRAQSAARTRLLGNRLGRANKMFTLVQGLSEIRFPEGFGMPVLSNDTFISHVMVMNPMERDELVLVGVDSRIEYVRESEIGKVMTPLFLAPFIALVPVESAGVDHTSHQHGGNESCLATDEDLVTASSVDRIGVTGQRPVRESESGRQLTGHWYVPPGRHVYRHRLEGIGKLIPFDTTAHYIYAHLHPFGESLELIDLTTGESVFKATARNYSERVAIENITHYSSPEGIAIFHDHEYEVVAVYDNTTGEEVDSMAVMYLYLRDSNSMKIALEPS